MGSVRQRIVAAILVLGFMASVRTGLAEPPAILADLRIPASTAHDRLLDGLWSGRGYLPGGAAAFKQAVAARRAEIVPALGEAARAYTRTDVFRQRYAEQRASRVPRPPQAPTSMSQQLAEQRKASEQAIVEMRKNAAQLPPDVRKQIEESIKEMLANQEAMAQDAELQASVDAAARQAHEAALERHRQAVAAFETEYPADPNVLIARRLREFLDMSASIDFDAALVERDRKMRFTDPRLEKQSFEWKLLFRAGPEAVAAARAFATEWLKELPPR